MAVNVTMEMMRTLLTQLDPQVKVDSCQVSGTRRSPGRAGAVAGYRVHVTGVALQSAGTPTPWARALLIKCLPSPPELASEARLWFRNESLVYSRALPALLSFQASQQRVTTPFSAAASCVTARAGRLLALDDPEARGFRPAAALSAAAPDLDAAHCDAALRELARLHALSLAMRRLRPEAFSAAVLDCVKEVVFLPEHAQAYLPHCCAITGEATSMMDAALPASDACRWRYLEHFRRFAGDPGAFFGRMTELAGSRESLSVLCHGACVPDNILFKYDDNGGVLEVCFVEFATARYASLALDVATLVCCCASHELRAQRLPRMLAEYHGTLVAQLSELLHGAAEAKLEHDPLEPHALWHTLQAEFRRCSRFGLGVAMDSLACGSSSRPRFLSVATREHVVCVEEDVSPRRRSAGEHCEPRSRKLTELVQELTDNGDL